MKQVLYQPVIVEPHEHVIGYEGRIEAERVEIIPARKNGNRIYVIEYDPNGRNRISEVDRDTGETFASFTSWLNSGIIFLDLERKHLVEAIKIVKSQNRRKRTA